MLKAKELERVLSIKEKIEKTIQKKLNKDSSYRFKVSLINKNNELELLISNKGVEFNVPLSVDIDEEFVMLWSEHEYTINTFYADIKDPSVIEMIMYLVKKIVSSTLVY